MISLFPLSREDFGEFYLWQFLKNAEEALAKLPYNILFVFKEELEEN